MMDVHIPMVCGTCFFSPHGKSIYRFLQYYVINVNLITHELKISQFMHPFPVMLLFLVFNQKYPCCLRTYLADPGLGLLLKVLCTPHILHIDVNLRVVHVNEIKMTRNE